MVLGILEAKINQHFANCRLDYGERKFRDINDVTVITLVFFATFYTVIGGIRFA